MECRELMGVINDKYTLIFLNVVVIVLKYTPTTVNMISYIQSIQLYVSRKYDLYQYAVYAYLTNR